MPAMPAPLRWLGAGVPAPATPSYRAPPEGQDILLSASWSRRLKDFKAGQLEEKMVTKLLSALMGEREDWWRGKRAEREARQGSRDLELGCR